MISIATSDNSNAEAIYQLSIVLVDQLVNLLKEIVIQNEQLTHQSTLIPGSTIGKHLRHIHDHFRLLLDSLAQETGGIRLDYDSRTRNLKSEISIEAALESFQHLQFRLERELGSDFDVSRKVVLDAKIPASIRVVSSLGREVWFACLHSTHHFALLRVIAVGELGLDVPPEFGVAPSTLLSRDTTTKL